MTHQANLPQMLCLLDLCSCEERDWCPASPLPLSFRHPEVSLTEDLMIFEL